MRTLHLVRHGRSRPDTEQPAERWLLDPAGVAPEIYAVAYAQAIAMARASWNLKEGPQDESAGPAAPDLVVG